LATVVGNLPDIAASRNRSTISEMGVSLAKGAPITNRRQDAILPTLVQQPACGSKKIVAAREEANA